MGAPKPGGGKGGGGAAIFVNLDIILLGHSMNQSYGFLYQEFLAHQEFVLHFQM
jgi:hypothetical protein